MVSSSKLGKMTGPMFERIKLAQSIKFNFRDYRYYREHLNKKQIVEVLDSLVRYIDSGLKKDFSDEMQKAYFQILVEQIIKAEKHLASGRGPKSFKTNSQENLY